MFKFILIFCFLIATNFFLGQTRSSVSKIDSLKNVIKISSLNDTVLIKSYEKLTVAFYPKEFDSVHFYGDKTIAQIESVKSNEEAVLNVLLQSKANVYNVKGNVFYMSGNVLKAIENYVEGLKINIKLSNLEAQASLMSNLAALYNSLGDIERSIDLNMQSLKIREQLNVPKDIAISLNNLGTIYTSQKEFEVAYQFYKKSLAIRDSLGDRKGVSSVYNNIGILKKEEGKDKEAFVYYQKALVIDKEIDNKDGIVISLINSGSYYQRIGELDKAIMYFKEGLSIAQEINYEEDEIHCLNKIANIYLEINDLVNAKINALVCFEKSENLGYPALIEQAAELLSSIYEKEGDADNALLMIKLAFAMKDSLFNEETQYLALKSQTQYQYEKEKEIDEAVFAQQITIEKEQQARQLVIIVAIVIILALTTIFLLYVFRRLQITKKQKNVIEEQRLAVESQKEALSFAHEKLEEVNKEMSDSIAYAELIQQAVLPTLKIEDLTKESFIYFNPKEKVSGDFYWMEQQGEFNGYAVADCTGHGIPGAFISMVGTILLNEIYNSKKIDVPNEILDELSRLVRLTLTNSDGYTMKDGMDISFAVLNNETKMLYFSGANNPVWIASNSPEKRINKQTALPITILNGKYIYEIKGDKQPIGEYGENIKPFTLNNAHLEEGDTFYLFTDGYVDQFGGERNKKFKAKPFRELLLSIQEKTMEEQKNILDQKFQSWKGEYEQIDDVTVMGVRV